MAQLKQATDQLRAQIDQVVATNRTDVVAAIEGRKAEYSSRAPSTPRQPRKPRRACCAKLTRRSPASALRTRSPSSARLGSSFEETVYPSLLDQLAAAQQGGGDGDAPPPPPKQTVSVKTISATGVSGVLETEADVDRYLDALRSALVKTLNDGKRISL